MTVSNSRVPRDRHHAKPTVGQDDAPCPIVSALTTQLLTTRGTRSPFVAS
jgi:hypothetical protein